MDFLNFLASLRTDFGENFWNLITKFGEETIIIVLLCVIYWCISKNMAYIVGFTFFLSGFLVQGLKITFRIDRPWILDPNFEPVEAAYDTATGYSFPSGHTQAGTAIYSSFGFQIKKWPRYILFILPLLIAFSRMYLGVHTPKDVITAFVLTLLISFVISFIAKKNTKYFNILLWIIICFGIVLITYALILYYQEVINYSYVSDCCKTAGSGIGFVVGAFLERKYVSFNPKTNKITKQLIKIVLGIAGVLVIQLGLKYLFLTLIGESLIIDFIRYFLITIWVMYLWPLIFTKKNKNS